MYEVFTTYIDNLAHETGIHESSISVSKGVYDRLYYSYLEHASDAHRYEGCPPPVKYGTPLTVFAVRGKLTISLLPET
jgi:hypothetical protein